MDSSEALCTKNVITCASCSTDNIPKGREREAQGLLKCTQHWTANLTRFPSVATQTNADIHACHKSTYIKITEKTGTTKRTEKKLTLRKLSRPFWCSRAVSPACLACQNRLWIKCARCVLLPRSLYLLMTPAHLSSRRNEQIEKSKRQGQKDKLKE